MLVVGQKFSFYEDVQRAVEEYENQNHVKFIKLRSKIFRKEYEPYNVKLRYRHISYHCFRGGYCQRKGKGVRNVSTLKQNCPALIELQATLDKNHLQVRKLVNEHNHELKERWIYFRESIPQNLRRKFQIRGVFIRNVKYQLDGVNLCAALVNPKIIPALQKITQGNNSNDSDNENTLTADSLVFGEVNEVNSKGMPVPVRALCSEENFSTQQTGSTDSSESALMETQHIIINTLTHLNQSIQTMTCDMVHLSTSINQLTESVNNITRVLIPESGNAENQCSITMEQ